MAGVNGVIAGGQQQTQTAYDANGRAIQVPIGTPLNTWKPNTGYSTGSMFSAPPPAVGAGGTGAPVYHSGVAGATQQIGQSAYEDQQQAELTAQLHAKAVQEQQAADAATAKEKSRLSNETFTNRLAQLSEAGASNVPAHVNVGGVNGNEQEARDAAFAHAKEQAGSTALASLKALQNIMDSRGMKGSSVEGNATAGVIGGAAGAVNDFTRDQAMADVNREAQLHDMQFEGDMTQRGQDLSLKQSLLGLMTAAGLY